MQTMIRTTLLLTAAVLFASGCSMEQIDAEWDTWVDGHNQCEQTADCALVYPGCPLGCYAGVAAEYEDEAARLADDLINRWSMGTRNCDYDCISAEVECVEERCEVIQTEEF